jgi:hypothetical protein
MNIDEIIMRASAIKLNIGDKQAVFEECDRIIAICEAVQQSVQADECPVCAGKRHIQTKSRGLVKCASCNGTGQRR